MRSSIFLTRLSKHVNKRALSHTADENLALQLSTTFHLNESEETV
jgi:hypothetical protein